MPLTIGTWLLALLPVLVVIVLMLGFKWGGARAGAAGWLTALLVAWLFFGSGWQLLSQTTIKSVFLSLDVLFVVWTALLVYNIANEAGAIQMIKKSIPTLSDDFVMQTLMVSWLLVSFLQGLGGFGVPIAVCAPILVSMGYDPLKAVVMSAIGHAWAVNFGSLASAFQSLMAVTGLPGETLAPMAALLLGIAALPCGVIVIWLGCGWKGVRRALPALLIISLVMGGTQYLLATNRLWTLATTGSAIAGMLVCFLLLKLPFYRSKRAESLSPLTNDDLAHGKPKRFLTATSAYILLVLIGFSVNLIPPLYEWLSRAKLVLNFPQLSTSLGWVTPAGPGRAIKLFSHSGSVLVYTSILSALIYWRKGYFKPGAGKRIARSVSDSALNASLGILSMVGLATIMSHAGMTNLLARGLSETLNRVVYPATVPFIGALGAFITGSNNNSNVLFGMLQMETAEMLKLGIPLILGAQTAGGSIGSIMSPAKVIVGCSTVGLSNKEGPALKKIMLFASIPLGIIALLTFLIALLA